MLELNTNIVQMSERFTDTYMEKPADFLFVSQFHSILCDMGVYSCINCSYFQLHLNTTLDILGKASDFQVWMLSIKAVPLQ